MPLEYLSNPSKMPFVEIYKQQNSQFYGRRSLSCRYQHVRLQGLKRKCFPHAQSAETIRNRERFDRKWVKISYTKMCDSSLHPVALRSCIPVSLYLCDLTPYTLHLTFSFFHFAIFGLSQSSKCKMAGAGGDALPACSCYFFMLFYLFFLTRGDTSRRAGPHPPLSPHDVAIPGYGASRRRSAYAACRWVCRSPRR